MHLYTEKRKKNILNVVYTIFPFFIFFIFFRKATHSFELDNYSNVSLSELLNRYGKWSRRAEFKYRVNLLHSFDTNARRNDLKLSLPFPAICSVEV